MMNNILPKVYLMRKIALILGLLFIAQIAQCEIVIEKLEDPPYLNPDGTIYAAPKNQDMQEASKNTTTVTTQTQYGSSISSSQLSKIERKVFGRNFVGDNNLNRLSRLEQKVFGAVQKGKTTNRLDRLKTATQSFANNYAPEYYYNQRPYYGYYNNYYPNPYNIYSPYRPFRRGRLKNFVRNLTGVSLTGYTPPVNNTVAQNGYTNSTIDPYTVYNNGFSSNNGYTWSNNYQNPYSGSTYSTYAGNTNQGYYTPANGSSIPPSNYMDIFSNGASGRETYYDDGRYRRSLNSTGGGCGVKIVY